MCSRLFLDADNTLWDTNAVYAVAQLSLARNVAGMSPCPAMLDQEDEAALRLVRALDQRLAVDHKYVLRYPPLLLAQALHVAFGGDGNDVALTEAVESYNAALAVKPQLRAGVRDGLAEVASIVGPLIVVTESREARCVDLLDHHGLAGYIGRIVCGVKSVAMYRDLRDVAYTDVMVGDQLDRDVSFAQAADFVGILFSGGFVPFWTSDLDFRPDFSIADFRELAPIMERLLSDGSSQSR